MKKIFKLAGLLLLAVFLVACQSNEIDNISNGGEQQHAIDDGESSAVDLGAVVESFPYLTYRGAEVLLVDLITGETLASYYVEDQYAEVSSVFNFNNGYFVALVGVMSPHELAIRRGDFNAELVEHDPNPRFLLFDDDLNLLEVFWINDTPYNSNFPFMFDLLTFYNNELVVFFMIAEDPSRPGNLLLQSYNFHTEEVTVITQTDIAIQEFVSVNVDQLFFTGFINETGSPFDPGTFVYGRINLESNVIEQQGERDFEPFGVDINNMQILIPEQREEPLLEDIHQVHHGVLLFDLQTSESRILNLQEGDGHLARLAYDGNHVVTISRYVNRDTLTSNFEYFRKYDLQVGALIHEIALDPIPELIEFADIRVSVSPVIIPISDNVYAIALFNDMNSGFYDIHQIIVLPN